MEVSEEEISVYAETKSATDTKSFVISNENGAAPLDYTLDISFERNNESRKESKSISNMSVNTGIAPKLSVSRA